MVSCKASDSCFAPFSWEHLLELSCRIGGGKRLHSVAHSDISVLHRGTVASSAANLTVSVLFPDSSKMRRGISSYILCADV